MGPDSQFSSGEHRYIAKTIYEFPFVGFRYNIYVYLLIIKRPEERFAGSDEQPRIY